MKAITKKYSNGEITIVWQPAICIHSTLCWKGETGLPEVFDPRVQPWIRPEGADTARIIEHVKRCPSGALSIYRNDEVPDNAAVQTERIVEVMPNGPLLVYGNIVVKDKEGHEVRKNKVTAFCRCGASGNKPFCDGTHTKTGFTG